MNIRRHFPGKLVTLLAALVLVPSGAALASQRYDDSAGDAPGGAPDITSVSISHKLAGDITFGVSFANRSVIAGQDEIWLWLDTDRNRSTGIGGADYIVIASGDAPSLAGIVQTATEAVVGVVPVSWANQTMTLVVNKAQLGAPANGFDFELFSHTGGEMSTQNTEVVPHSGTLTYSLATEIAQIQLPKLVTTIKAGKVFSIKGATVKLTTDEVFAPETLVGNAKIGGKAVKPLAGGLAWKVPKAAKGKRLVVTMTASYQGMKKVQTLTLRVIK